MSMEHEFLLISVDDHPPTGDFCWLVRHPRAHRIHDELLRYIDDSLRWIPTLNPASNEHGFGLNFWGHTAITDRGAQAAASIFRAWYQLFQQGPRELVLTGSWSTLEGSVDSGQYERISLDRDIICGAFHALALDFERVAASRGSLFVAHAGI